MGGGGDSRTPSDDLTARWWLAKSSSSPLWDCNIRPNSDGLLLGGPGVFGADLGWPRWVLTIRTTSGFGDLGWQHPCWQLTKGDPLSMLLPESVANTKLVQMVGHACRGQLDRTYRDKGLSVRGVSTFREGRKRRAYRTKPLHPEPFDGQGGGGCASKQRTQTPRENNMPILR